MARFRFENQQKMLIPFLKAKDSDLIYENQLAHMSHLEWGRAQNHQKLQKKGHWNKCNTP